VPGADLDVAKRHPGVEGGHDERSSEHVRLDLVQSRSLADGADPPVRGAPVEAPAVVPAQDRPLVAFAHGEVDSARRAWHERDRGGLVALAHDAQRAVAGFEAEVLDVGGARFADPHR
jgi:hypothetical protein